MSGKPSLRIDWFDGTLVDDIRPNASSSQFADEDATGSEPEPSQPAFTEKKPIGFKRLLDISLMKPPILTLEVSHRPGFWNLLDVNDLKGDFIVLIVKILGNVYKSLDPNETSKIATMLRTRFLNSSFLDRVKSYADDLPRVRIVEKKMNCYLWDDVEAFYFQVVELCEGILNFEGLNVKQLENVRHLLEILETSAIGVKEEHTETFSEELFIQINEIKARSLNLIDEKVFPENNSQSKSQDPNHFKNLDMFPSRNDLMGESKVKIVPNIVNGAYPSVEHYLDIQFKLLREDCFGPLREGINKYMLNPSKRRHENIRVHPKVRAIRTYVSNNRVGHLIDIAWADRVTHSTIDSKKFAYNKQLMFGSLLLLTSDNFETILCATVLDSSLALLQEGYLAVSFQNPVSKEVFSQSYLMIESEVFFEPYHQVLKVIQNSRLDDLPMKRYIVNVEPETKSPAYLTPKTIYTIFEPNKKEEIPFPVLDTTQWPTPSLGLDSSQFEAYKFALTREFAVIQGPPGTGKTFLGIKIASTLLKNLSLEGTPMLVICYTNHALDKFLEGLLGVTQNIVRLGSQSKNKALEPYSLNSVRARVKCKYSYLYGKKRAELESIFKDMMDIQLEIEKCEKTLLSYTTIKKHLNINDKNYELKYSKEDRVLSWLFAHIEDKLEDEEDDVEDWEKQFDDLNEGNKIETCFSEQWALKEIESLKGSIKYVNDVTDDHLEGQKMTDRLESQIGKVRKRINYFKKQIALLHNDKPNVKLDEVEDVYQLSPEQRWFLYFEAVEAIKTELLSKMNILLDRYNTANQELEEVSALIDSEVMRTTRVVGVTTTAAARRHLLLTKLLSPIVIVEEAAEVLEAHIVASLTHHCKHLILIGDHKQLRPSAASFKLAKDYNLEISLFERMIRNGVHARTLTSQRRMRTTFCELLVPVIYERLDCDRSVLCYGGVKGMKDNLYFYSHDVFEDSEGLEDSWSHKNTLEAKWCVALASYLRMYYSPQDVTILTTYTGQVNLIKELSKKYKSLRDVKITAVDNFQGQESRIVILSLVRSNRDGNIGFLAAPNRICVALSRAKEGFYMFGNMNALKAASPVWRYINDKLLSLGAIGKKITVQTPTNDTKTFDVENVENFDSCF